MGTKAVLKIESFAFFGRTLPFLALPKDETRIHLVSGQPNSAKLALYCTSLAMLFLFYGLLPCDFCFNFELHLQMLLDSRRPLFRY